MIGVRGCQGEMGMGAVHPAVAAEAGVIGVEHDSVATRRSLKLVVAEGADGVEIECENQTGALEDQHFVVVVLPQLVR